MRFTQYVVIEPGTVYLIDITENGAYWLTVMSDQDGNSRIQL